MGGLEVRPMGGKQFQKIFRLPEFLGKSPKDYPNLGNPNRNYDSHPHIQEAYAAIPLTNKTRRVTTPPAVEKPPPPTIDWNPADTARYSSITLPIHEAQELHRRIETSSFNRNWAPHPESRNRVHVTAPGHWCAERANVTKDTTDIVRDGEKSDQYEGICECGRFASHTMIGNEGSSEEERAAEKQAKQ